MERGGGCAEVRAVKSGIRVKSGGGVGCRDESCWEQW